MASLLISHTMTNGVKSGDVQIASPSFEAELLVWFGKQASTLGNMRVHITMEPSLVPEMRTSEVGAWLRSVLVEALSEGDD